MSGTERDTGNSSNEADDGYLRRSKRISGRSSSEAEKSPKRSRSKFYEERDSTSKEGKSSKNKDNKGTKQVKLPVDRNNNANPVNSNKKGEESNESSIADF